jgi:hypothetical protein
MLYFVTEMGKNGLVEKILVLILTLEILFKFSS